MRKQKQYRQERKDSCNLRKSSEDLSSSRADEAIIATNRKNKTYKPKGKNREQKETQDQAPRRVVMPNYEDSSKKRKGKEGKHTRKSISSKRRKYEKERESKASLCLGISDMVSAGSVVTRDPSPDKLSPSTIQDSKLRANLSDSESESEYLCQNEVQDSKTKVNKDDNNRQR